MSARDENRAHNARIPCASVNSCSLESQLVSVYNETTPYIYQINTES